MDSLKEKLEKNIEVFNAQISHFNLKKVDIIKSNEVYERLVNWVAGEFDLYLMDESGFLQVYFPNGWFIIRNFKDEDKRKIIEIKVAGKSSVACQKMMDQLERIYNHVLGFAESNAAQYA